MTNESQIEGRHSREGGNPVASIWHLLHYHLGFLDNQIDLCWKWLFYLHYSSYN
jgi:hypothetical protein